MDPRRQGQLLHEVFEAFFAQWQKAGRGAITPGNLDEARAMFAAAVDHILEQLPDAEAGLERTRLLGSSAAAGLGEAVLRMEAERPVAVVERLLEHRLEGAFSIATASGPRVVAIRGKADRLDLLEDGTFRLIDYKLGWPPDRGRALQLPIYGICAEQRLTADRGRRLAPRRSRVPCVQGPETGRAAVCHELAEGRGPGQSAAAARRHARRDRAWRVPAGAGRRLSMRNMQLRVGVQEGLCRRSLSRVCRSTTKRPISQVSRLKVSRLKPDVSSLESEVSGLTPEDSVLTSRVSSLPATMRRPSGRRRSLAERRARGVGGHREDACPRRAVCESAARGRRSGSHSRDDVHPEGRGRDARAHHRSAARGQPELAARPRAVARSQGSPRRHFDLHHRRLLPVAAA